MKKVVVAGLIILLAIGAYWGRGLLPGDQLKQDIVVAQVASYMEIQEALVHMEDSMESSANFEDNWLIAYHRAQSLQAINSIPRDQDGLVNSGSGTLPFEVRSQLEEIRRMDLSDDNLLVTIETLRGRIDAFLNEMGTVSDIRNEYTPSSVLIERMERAEVIDGIY
ncbi:hypothetical protein FLK61_41530 [Paenalkalicoccus suaedae]|uniref:Uncharacterized protein n=1 Tax=Paenalkalicoccus suaedae TaxID=2592382 RepID=A0A859FJU8_9BACI|nr:hypothetical protein [Paenalkalicoccus suaedae]QKS73073.1 hypothetical protein FLK61_41530 [Paenalkalicoccus suaedae]